MRASSIFIGFKPHSKTQAICLTRMDRYSLKASLVGDSIFRLLSPAKFVVTYSQEPPLQSAVQLQAAKNAFSRS